MHRKFILLWAVTIVCVQPLVAQPLGSVPAVGKSLNAGIYLKAHNDFSKSPYTGYTRQHWLEITEKIIVGSLTHLNRETGMPEFPAFQMGDEAYEKLRRKNPEESGKRGLERMMMAIAIYTTATGKDEVPGYKGSISAPFIKAIVNGTDPASPDYWGEPLPNDQVGANFALAIYLEPNRYWEPLTQKQKDNLLNYFKKQVYLKTYNNNATGTMWK